MPPPMLAIDKLSKVYAGGRLALDGIDLAVPRGEIFALLGPNGAGKTTLINAVCGIVRPSAGRIAVDGHDVVADYRAARALVGLVPQDQSGDAFETVLNTVSYSRGLYGRAPDPAHVERVLRSLALWERKDSKVMTLSGGMKRRVLIAKALSHEPRLLFLDEPTAGVDVELRREMWQLVRGLRAGGVTVILTTHYIEEAQEMADRVGVINKGRLLLVEDKATLLRRFGRKRLVIELREPLAALPPALAGRGLERSDDGGTLTLRYDAAGQPPDLGALLAALQAEGLALVDLHTSQSTLEQIFVGLVTDDAPTARDDDEAAR